MKNLTDIAVFVQVVDGGSFTNAAGQWGLYGKPRCMG
jgi:DNA-binding transcriptional LysR family regulator